MADPPAPKAAPGTPSVKVNTSPGLQLLDRAGVLVRQRKQNIRCLADLEDTRRYCVGGHDVRAIGLCRGGAQLEGEEEKAAHRCHEVSGSAEAFSQTVVDRISGRGGLLPLRE
jgi:hypothetical protein